MQTLASELQERLAQVAGAAIVGIGDNVLDCYMFEHLAYPGGNALNVAAYTRILLGGGSAFIGIVGIDRFGEHLLSVLDHVGVDRALCRRAAGPTGLAFVELDEDGDRKFTASNRGGVQQHLRIRLSEPDMDYITKYDRVHTSTYSGLDGDLERISSVVPVSYDFSDDSSNITHVAPHVDLGFFSGSGLSPSELNQTGEMALAAGIQQLVITQGSRGSVVYTQEGVFEGKIFRVPAVDALGAGDAFISGYLSAFSAGLGIDRCLEVGAMTGALACTMRGAFGYPVLAGPDAMQQMQESLAIRRRSAADSGG